MSKVPKSKATQAAEIIKTSIAEGVWDDYLPSERKLSADLIISRTCLRQALEILTNEGVLEPVSQSKRREITVSRSRKRKSKLKKVIFLTPKPAHLATSILLEQVASLRHYLAKADVTLEMVSSPVYGQPNARHKTIQKLVDDYPNCQWVLHQSPEHIQKWFSESSLPVIVLGSIFEGIQLPNVAIDLRSGVRHATGSLLAKGHKNLALIRFRAELAGDNLAVDGMNEAIEVHNDSSIRPPRILTHNFHIERLVGALENLFKMEHPPTALIVLNHHHFVTAFTHLLSLGIRIPDDVSLISLTHDPVLEYLSPCPVSYTAGDRLIRTLARMVLNSASRKKSKSALLIPEARPGKTIAVCPAQSKSLL